MSEKYESATPQSLEEYRYDTGDVFQGMGGDYWTVTARLWNFDAKETERHGHYGETYEVTMDHDRREYELTSLDPRQLGDETQRLSEHDLASHFQGATAAEAREHYREEPSDGDLVTDGGKETAGDQHEEITIEGISSDALRALFQAVHDAGHDISVQTDVTLGRLSEDRVEDLLAALHEYEKKSSKNGAHDQAQSADRLYRQIERQYDE